MFHMDTIKSLALVCLIFALDRMRPAEAQVKSEQSPVEPQLLHVDDTMKLWCRTDSDSNSLTWYRRGPPNSKRTGLEMLAFSYASSSKTDLSSAPSDVTDRMESSRTGIELTLELKSLKPGDSGVYFCAARDAL
ncbi:hypothetical protein SKAU_G00031880 [Synaphobranchus kaupii]|uniref:Ig-like domain-containing protein n=1 Tax=Synaphobranchus kaupii TaxID=118154 RepID=A0A9Q1JF72_SYNKA|nr:hypothetical protein SKAU_G00031880 [Synaphobranchus kaupii]